MAVVFTSASIQILTKKMTTTEYKTPKLTLFVKDQYILAVANENTTISESEMSFLSTVAKKHFSGPFGVIEVRDKNISIDPELHAKAKQAIPNFAAYALVTNRVSAIKSLENEEAFMKYEKFRLCSSIEEATEWMNFILPESAS